jgi:plasmid stabilization system protein ParE
VAQVIYSSAALADVERLVEFLSGQSPELADEAVERIIEAIALLERHPLLGRIVEAGLRELVISRGKTGYVALYRFLPLTETVLVLAMRHQREAGYSDLDEDH